MIDIVDKPLEEQDIAGDSINLFDGESGKQKHDDIGNLCLVERHRWNMDWCIFMEIISMTQIVRI